MEAGVGALNPWRSMWVRPRDTVRYLVGTEPQRAVLLLAAVAGISQALDRASLSRVGDSLSMPIILAIVLIAGPIFGILGLYLAGALIAWTGNWIGGSASQQHIRTAVAWANVPIVAALALWVVQIALYGSDLFTTATPRLEASPQLSLLLLVFGLAFIVLGVWALVLLFKGVGEVQGFSAWKALGNVLLSVLAIVVPIVVLVVGAMALGG